MNKAQAKEMFQNTQKQIMAHHIKNAGVNPAFLEVEPGLTDEQINEKLDRMNKENAETAMLTAGKPRNAPKMKYKGKNVSAPIPTTATPAGLKKYEEKIDDKALKLFQVEQKDRKKMAKVQDTVDKAGLRLFAANKKKGGGK